MKNKLIIIDNFDSFTYNLYQQIQRLYSGKVEVFRNNKISVSEIEKKKYRGIIISPGPKRPKDAGVSNKVVKIFAGKLPILGICLGMQCINEVFGGITTESNFPVHGKTTKIIHNQQGLFENIRNEIKVARYHSLKIDKIPKTLKVSAQTEDNIPMAISHTQFPIFGVQFHPESFLTEAGDQLIQNFLNDV